ncbi:GntR family transcriptional regulator [Microbacterium sp. A93]|uniref:GntR family transcriptional regulator n=1 Tax=Microbacterium sp. A93 TaxID=3450716 RepID=UPI003F433C7C
MTARDRVARELRHRVLLGSLKAGDRLDLDALAEEFGTSRTPVREATLELANDNLVKLAPRSGITVLGITASDLLDNFELMANLAGMAAGWAALRATPEDVERIRTTGDAVVAASESGGDVALANFKFHRSVNQASHSSRVMALIAQTARLFPERFSDVVPDQVPCSLREHADLVDAITDRDQPKARLLMMSHFQDAAVRLRAHLHVGDDSLLSDQ